MARQLTENQVKFLEVLFDEAGGDVVKAKKLAGYSDNTILLRMRSLMALRRTWHVLDLRQL